jgi:large subunit ribosomal protein LP1
MALRSLYVDPSNTRLGARTEADEKQADKITTILKAANLTEVEPIWASLFAKALEGKDVKDMLSNVGSGGGAAAAPAAGGAAGGAGGDAAEEAKEEEKKEEGQSRRIYASQTGTMKSWLTKDE